MKILYPHVHIVKYNRQDHKKMVGIVFNNFHEILAGRDYVKYLISGNRIYFDFTNEKDIHTFKLTFAGSYKVTDAKAQQSANYSRKIQLDTDERLLAFCGKDYSPYYDDESSMYYIENSTNFKKLF